MQDGHDNIRDGRSVAHSGEFSERVSRRRQLLGRLGVLVAALELILLRALVDTEVWVRLGGHGIDQHVLLVVVGLAVVGILASGVVAVALVHAGHVTARLRAVLVLAAQAGVGSAETRRRRRRAAVVPRGRPVRTPVGATGPRAPGSPFRRPAGRTPLAG